jgi:hypothetical protein
MSRHKHRTALAVGAGLLVMAIGALLFGAFTGSAQAIGLVNVPASHQQATLNTINNRPNLVSVVLSVWPAFYVRGGYGGQAWPGYIDVNTAQLSGKAYTHQVAHEWCHEVQLACDAPGGYGSLIVAWRAFMASTWPQVNTSQWTGATWNHTLMEAMREFWRPYYANAPEYRVYATRAQMTTILQGCGVTP